MSISIFNSTTFYRQFEYIKIKEWSLLLVHFSRNIGHILDNKLQLTSVQEDLFKHLDITAISNVPHH